ncbi:iron(III) ABC transporter [Pseudomonas sp. gcc21]|uniref:ChaN family lipoprotein n=1 Tax=Pseudomonas sp. gcc21 TaxID=2726989 RepID=UPI0014517F86|nr:ChaN family lipoprotein [Pseudomonas sp. gcc21]QJD60288.1 iron(III) ABC transporter [Pseudomonas sp. gcc21]
MKAFLIGFAILFSLGTQAKPLPEWVSPLHTEHPQVGQVKDTATGEWINPVELVEVLADAPHVMVGEKHDNADHHRLQLWLLRALAERRPQASLLLEMLAPEQQAAADALLRNDKLTDETLQARLNWAPGWDWTLYGDLVRWGLNESGRLLAANIAEDEMKNRYREPSPLRDVYSEDAGRQLRETIVASHCGKLSETHFPAMLSIQQARDQRMAEALHAADQPALLLAGNFHVRKDLGAPLHWPGNSAPVVVMLIEAGQTPPDAAQADYVWLTAAMEPKDYCADW